MSRLSEFFARKPISFAEKVPLLSAAQNGDAARRDLDSFLDGFNDETFAEVGSRMGEENEALRGLVVETARKIGELDEVKQAFGRIIDPLHKTLLALEHEKSKNASLIGALSETHTAMETLRDDLQQSERLAASLAETNEQLQEELQQAQQTLAGLESNRIELVNEAAIKTAEITNLENRLAAENANRQSLSDDNRILSEQSEAADKRLVQLETEIVTARQKLALSEDDRHSLQTSLDQTLGEVSRLSRQLADSRNTLAAAKARLGQLEPMFADADAERTKLAAVLDETKERHRAESSAQTMRLEVLQSHAATAEKLLIEARQSLATRAEEVRTFDRKVVEVTIARNAAEKKLNQLEALQQAQESQIKDLEQARTALAEHSAALTKNVKTRETALARAEEKIRSVMEQVVRLEIGNQASRSRAERRIEELNATLERERMDRAVAEGALEATRKDNARLLREIAALEDSPRYGPVADETSLVPKPKQSTAPGKNTVGPIIKA